MIGPLTLTWKGFHNQETKLETADGRDLFQMLSVREIAFRGSKDAKGELVLHVNLTGFGLRAGIARVILADDDLHELARMAGYYLTPLSPIDGAPPGDRVRALEEALVWCSGAACFGPKGEAHEGFLALVRPLLETIGVPSVGGQK